MIGIIGAGNMGEALIKGLSAKDTIVSDVSNERLWLLRKKYGVLAAASNIELVKRSGIIILAVKPKQVDDVICEIKSFLSRKKLIISIAAGITTGRIEKKIGIDIPVVRAMPNMPALIGEGISAICRGKFAKNSDKNTAHKILSAVGSVVEVGEDLMDAVTAVSGSGPAYFFFLVEALIGSGVKQGLSEDIARTLAVQTARGAAGLLLKTSQNPRVLRQKVTSKGGTTEAAFEAFKEEGLGDILERGITAAVKRSKEISCS